MGIRLRWYLLTLLLARVPRYVGLAWLGATSGADALPWLKAHAWHMVLVALALYVGIYLATRHSRA